MWWQLFPHFPCPEREIQCRGVHWVMKATNGTQMEYCEIMSISIASTQNRIPIAALGRHIFVELLRCYLQIKGNYGNQSGLKWQEMALGYKGLRWVGSI